MEIMVYLQVKTWKNWYIILTLQFLAFVYHTVSQTAIREKNNFTGKYQSIREMIRRTAHNISLGELQ